MTIHLYFTLILLASQLAASPLLSDGDETTSIGTARAITPHPAWAQPLEGTSWISIAQTGWPLLTQVPNGTVVSYSEGFSFASMPSSATISFAADDSAGLFINGHLVLPEAPIAGNTYATCSDVGPTCTSHTTVDVLPWLTLGENTLRFDVAQRNGWSYGLNYRGSLAWLSDPPAVETPEPGTGWLVVIGAIGGALGALAVHWLKGPIAWRTARVWRLERALRSIADWSADEESKKLARKALEE